MVGYIYNIALYYQSNLQQNIEINRKATLMGTSMSYGETEKAKKAFRNNAIKRSKISPHMEKYYRYKKQYMHSIDKAESQMYDHHDRNQNRRNQMRRTETKAEHARGQDDNDEFDLPHDIPSIEHHSDIQNPKASRSQIPEEQQWSDDEPVKPQQQKQLNSSKHQLKQKQSMKLPVQQTTSHFFIATNPKDNCTVNIHNNNNSRRPNNAANMGTDIPNQDITNFYSFKTQPVPTLNANNYYIQNMSNKTYANGEHTMQNQACFTETLRQGKSQQSKQTYQKIIEGNTKNQAIHRQSGGSGSLSSAANLKSSSNNNSSSNKKSSSNSKKVESNHALSQVILQRDPNSYTINYYDDIKEEAEDQSALLQNHPGKAHTEGNNWKYMDYRCQFTQSDPISSDDENQSQSQNSQVKNIEPKPTATAQRSSTPNPNSNPPPSLQRIPTIQLCPTTSLPIASITTQSLKSQPFGCILELNSNINPPMFQPSVSLKPNHNLTPTYVSWVSNNGNSANTGSNMSGRPRKLLYF